MRRLDRKSCIILPSQNRQENHRSVADNLIAEGGVLLNAPLLWIKINDGNNFRCGDTTCTMMTIIFIINWL